MIKKFDNPTYPNLKYTCMKKIVRLSFLSLYTMVSYRVFCWGRKQLIIGNTVCELRKYPPSVNVVRVIYDDFFSEDLNFQSIYYNKLYHAYVYLLLLLS